MAATGVSLVANGSHHTREATPDTPAVSDGHRLGPTSYQAMPGAFVVGSDGARLVDLAGLDLRLALNRSGRLPEGLGRRLPAGLLRT